MTFPTSGDPEPSPDTESTGIAGTTGSAAPAEARRRILGPRARNVVEWVVVIGGALLVALALRAFVFQTFFIPSGSMLPTLHEGDRVVVNKISDDFNRTDIVVFVRPETWQGTHHDLIKRVIATGGETIEIRENTVFIDGEPIDEPYLEAGNVMQDYGPETVPEDHIFVMGDNRNQSSDSRQNTTVPEDAVVGRAFVRIWPPGDIGGL